jgi:uncharacterized membrane protein
VPTLKKMIRSLIVALVLIGAVAGGVTVAHQSMTLADSGSQSGSYDAG